MLKAPENMPRQIAADAKAKDKSQLTYYPDARREEPMPPAASRAQKSALFAMCVLIPFLTAANCSLFSSGIPVPALAPATSQSVNQLAAAGSAIHSGADPNNLLEDRAARLPGGLSGPG